MFILCLIVVKITNYVVILISRHNYYLIWVGVIPTCSKKIFLCANPTVYFFICWGIIRNGIKCVSKYMREPFFTVGNGWRHGWPNIWLTMSSAYTTNNTNGKLFTSCTHEKNRVGVTLIHKRNAYGENIEKLYIYICIYIYIYLLPKF